MILFPLEDGINPRKFMTFSGFSYQKDSFTIQSPNAFLHTEFSGLKGHKICILGGMHGTEDFLGVGKCNFISVKAVNLYLVHQLFEKGREWDSCLQLSLAETHLYISPL